MIHMATPQLMRSDNPPLYTIFIEPIKGPTYLELMRGFRLFTLMPLLLSLVWLAFLVIPKMRTHTFRFDTKIKIAIILSIIFIGSAALTETDIVRHANDDKLEGVTSNKTYLFGYYF